MNIYILEDDLYQRNRIKEVIKEIRTTSNFRIKKIFDTGRPEELIESIVERGCHMLFFLDIEIKESQKKGLDIAKKIRELDRYATIVFVTTHSEFSFLTYSYQVSALNFIAKDQNEESFREQIYESIQYVDRGMDEEKPTDVFQFESEFKKFWVPFSEILYFETLPQPHKIVLVTLKQRIEFYGNLAEIETMDSRLYRCHKSFVVNLKSIVVIDRAKNLLILKKDENCLLSRRKLKNIAERLLDI